MTVEQSTSGRSEPREPVFDSAFVEQTLGGLLHDRAGGDAAFTRAVIDSRQVRPGDLFVALPGERSDGHDHAVAAARAGATGLLLDHPVAGLDDNEVAQFYVPDTLIALQLLAARWRAALPATEVIGITGNVGKTTTKLIAAAILGEQYRVAANPLNYNNEIGVPLCLLELTPAIERAVIEHGMYTTGEIALLCHWTRPQVGVVLNVGPVHLERAGSMETIARAKQELVQALPEDGWALLNTDDPAVDAMAAQTRARVLRFGTTAAADVRADAIVGRGAAGFSFNLHAPSHLGADRAEWGAATVRRVHCPLPGKHLWSNVLAAAAIALTSGLTLDQIAAAIERLDVPLRLSIRALPTGVTLLDDTYNASPAATVAALDLLDEVERPPAARRVALLGDMRELGPQSEERHREVGRHAAATCDVLFTIGTEAAVIGVAAREANPEHPPTDIRHFDDRATAAAALTELLQPGDVLLIKGSRALELETVVAMLDGDRAAEGETGRQP